MSVEIKILQAIRNQCTMKITASIEYRWMLLYIILFTRSNILLYYQFFY
jgi:hypothetical protein